jgi:hypothetical protein
VNYYEARKLKDGSGWHFTGFNKRPRPDGECWPVGYCAEHEAHAERWEAEECFRAYLLDGAQEEEYGDWTGCEICAEPTKKGLTARRPLGNGYPLCDEHRTPETLGTLVKKPSQITASY